MSSEHGQYDPSLQKWFCGYWMSQSEWLDVHDYAPSAQKAEIEEQDEE